MTSTFPAPAWWDPTRPVPDMRTELPGPRAREVLAADAAMTSPSLPRAYPMVPRRGHGAALEDADGNLFLDFNAGIAVNSTGHSHPRVVAAVREQAEDLLHYSASDFYLPIYSQMCAALAEVAPMSGPTRVFLTNSGAEGVEGALKLARYASGRPYVIAFYGAFHGRTYGAVSLTASKAKYHTGFGPLLPGVLHAPYAFASATRRPASAATTRSRPSTTWRTCCSGTMSPRPRWRRSSSSRSRARVATSCRRSSGWSGCASCCDRHGILLVADEVQSGMGRTGKMWAIEHAGVEPDVLISGQGPGVRAAAGRVRGPGRADGDVGRRRARLDVRRQPGAVRGRARDAGDHPRGGPAAHATEVGDFLLSRLAELPGRFPGLVTDVRGIGLMIGVEFRTAEQAEAAQQGSFERGLLVLECGETTVRMSPPLVVSLDQAKTALDLFGAVLAELAG